MEIRELTKNDLPSLLEIYIQLSENNKTITKEKFAAVFAEDNSFAGLLEKDENGYFKYSFVVH